MFLGTNMMQLLNYLCGNPVDTPTRKYCAPVRVKIQMNISSTRYVGRKAVATSALHQGCPVFVCDCQLVAARLCVEGGELYVEHHPILHSYGFSSPQVSRVSVWVVRGCDNTCEKRLNLRTDKKI